MHDTYGLVEVTPWRRHGPVVVAFGCFLLWTGVTWLLEGRIQTLIRPEATLDRLVYAAVANVGIGQIGAFAALGLLVHRTSAGGIRLRRPRLGRRCLALIGAVALGLGYYLLAGGSRANAVLLTNASAQVFVVSAAEVVVCWGLLGSAAESWLRTRLGPWTAAAGAAITASAAFGLYHFAHSPPFNSPGMVAFLALVGLGTSLFFFVTRDLLATTVFHTFPAVAGVTAVLMQTGEPVSLTLTHLQPALLSTAMASLLVVLVGERLALDRRGQPG